MTSEEMLIKAAKKLEKYNIEQGIEIRYSDGVFQAYVMEEDLQDNMFYGDGFTLEEALNHLIYNDEGINNIEEILRERAEEEQRELAYKNKVYWDKQLYRNA